MADSVTLFNPSACDSHLHSAPNGITLPLAKIEMDVTHYCNITPEEKNKLQHKIWAEYISKGSNNTRMNVLALYRQGQFGQQEQITRVPILGSVFCVAGIGYSMCLKGSAVLDIITGRIGEMTLKNCLAHLVRKGFFRGLSGSCFYGGILVGFGGIAFTAVQLYLIFQEANAIRTNSAKPEIPDSTPTPPRSGTGPIADTRLQD